MLKINFLLGVIPFYNLKERLHCSKFSYSSENDKRHLSHQIDCIINFWKEVIEIFKLKEFTAILWEFSEKETKNM